MNHSPDAVELERSWALFVVTRDFRFFPNPADIAALTQRQLLDRFYTRLSSAI